MSRLLPSTPDSRGMSRHSSRHTAAENQTAEVELFQPRCTNGSGKLRHQRKLGGKRHFLNLTCCLSLDADAAKTAPKSSPGLPAYLHTNSVPAQSDSAPGRRAPPPPRMRSTVGRLRRQRRYPSSSSSSSSVRAFLMDVTGCCRCNIVVLEALELRGDCSGA